MTTRQIEIFLSLVKTKSFTATAKALYMTQPAVSQQIQALENDISCTLFIRQKKGLTLTPAGIAFYEEASSLLAHTHSVYHKVRQSSIQNKITRSLYYLPPLRILPMLVSEFTKLHPEIFLSICKSDFMEQNSLLAFKQHDISVGFGDPDTDYGELEFVTLYSGNLVCFLHKEHPLAKKERITAEDLIGETVYSINEFLQNEMLHRLNEYLSHTTGIFFFPKLVGSYECSVIAATGQCIAILPNISSPIMEECVVARPFELPFTFHIGLYVANDAPEDIWDFCDLAVKICKEDKLPPVVY